MLTPVSNWGKNKSTEQSIMLSRVLDTLLVRWWQFCHCAVEITGVESLYKCQLQPEPSVTRNQTERTVLCMQQTWLASVSALRLAIFQTLTSASVQCQYLVLIRYYDSGRSELPLWALFIPGDPRQSLARHHLNITAIVCLLRKRKMAHVKRFRGIPMSKVRSCKVVRAETGMEPEVQRQQCIRKCFQ